MAPTGVAMRDARTQLFDAAERVLLRDGPGGLSSRAVTTEANCAKGVLHRHFADFDAFLAEFVLDRAHRLAEEIATLHDRAGTGAIVDNVTGALMSVFDSVAVAIVPLITFRDELRNRLRETWPAGVPVLTQAAILFAGYLEAERELGRLAEDADADVLAATLIGSAHLLFADRTAARPGAEAVRKSVDAILGAVVRELADRGRRPLCSARRRRAASRVAGRCGNAPPSAPADVPARGHVDAPAQAALQLARVRNSGGAVTVAAASDHIDSRPHWQRA